MIDIGLLDIVELGIIFVYRLLFYLRNYNDDIWN